MDADCFQTYLQQCRGFSLPAPWNRLTTPGAYRTPEEPAKALDELLKRHDVAQLLSCGLVAKDENDGFQISPLLSQPNIALIALQDAGGISNLLTASGCIRGEHLPMFGALEDEHARTAIQSGQREVILTATVEDAIVLRAVGLIAVPAVGLTELGQSGVELLQKFYGLRAVSAWRADARDDAPAYGASSDLGAWRSVANESEINFSDEQRTHEDKEQLRRPESDGLGQADAEPLELMLARWSPSSLSRAEPEVIRNVAGSLRELAEFRAVQIHEIAEWRPDADDIRAIRFAEGRGDVGWLKDAVLRSLDRSCYTLSEASPIAERESLGRAAEELNKALFDTDVGNEGLIRKKQAIDAYRRIAMIQLVEPLVRLSDVELDPLMRLQLLHCAHLGELELAKMASIRERFFLAKRSPLSLIDLADNRSVKEMLAIGSQIRALTKEMQQWTQHQNNSLPKWASRRISYPRSGSWGSTEAN